MIGRKLTIGCGSLTGRPPRLEDRHRRAEGRRQESRKPSAAVSGTRIERNTRISSRNAAPATMAMYGTIEPSNPVVDVGVDRRGAGDAVLHPELLVKPASRRGRP